MGIGRKAAQPLLDAIGKRITKPLGIFVEEAVPKVDIPTLVRLSKEEPPKFDTWLKRTNDYVNGEPGGGLEAANLVDKARAAHQEIDLKGQVLAQKHHDPISSSQVEPKAYNLSEGVEDFMGDTDLPTARAWENPDGELDKALQDMLTVKKKTTITTPEGKKVTLNKGDMMTPDMLTGSKKDYYNSLIATGFKTAPDDELVYGFGGQELSKMAGLEGKDPGFSPQLHKGKSFHHKSMKEIQSAIHKRARALRESGDATTDDLINLHALSNSMGAPSGSRKSAGMWLEEFGHNITHKQTAQRKGIEPTTTRWTNEFRGEGKPKQVPTKLWNPAKKAADDLGVKLTPFDIDYIKRQGDPLESAIAKWKVFRETKMYDALKPDGQSEMSRLVKSTENMSIAELTKFQKEMLEDITKPMTDEMVLMEEVMDNLSARELLELMKKKDWQTPLNLRRALKEKKAAIVEAKSDKALRKQMNTAYN